MKQALVWYKKAAEQGHPDAQYHLGDLYNIGRRYCGVPTDKKQAMEWFCKAAEGYRKLAERGDADAQYSLAGMTYRGEGVSKDEDKAFGWYKKAAEQSHSRALERLREFAERRWDAKCTPHTTANAQYFLGVLAEFGRCGVRKNRMHASAWYRKAAKQGHKEAKEALERLNS